MWNPLHSLATALFRHQADIGFKPKPWSGNNFKGWQCGSVQISKRDEELMVRLSSDSAFINWKRIVPLADNVSRLDLQATIKKHGPVGPTITQHREAAQKHSDAHKKKPVVRWIQDNREAYTLYLGHRESNVFGRIYDKGAREKTKEYEHCIRYEAQFQHDLSRIVARELCSLDSPIARMASHLTSFFRIRQVDLKLPDDNAARYSCPRQRTDDDRQLTWLSTQCRPSVLRLIRNGKGEEVLRALGLISETEGE